MPVYEYTCDQCGHAWEHFARSMNRPDKPECPKCGSSNASRQHSSFNAREGSTQQACPPSSCTSCCNDGQCPMQM